MAQRTARLSKPQRRVGSRGHRSGTTVNGIVWVPIAKCVWMLSTFSAKLTQRHAEHFCHPEVGKNPMVAFARAFVSKQAEEKEGVANTDFLVSEMGLCRPALSKQALASHKHRVVVTQVIASNLSTSYLLDEVAQSQAIVGCNRTPRRWDR